MKKVLIAVIFALTILASDLSFANWGGSGNIGTFGAGHLQAMGTKDVELLNEDLHIALYKDHALVTVEYIFRNTGADTIVKAGFPDIVFMNKSEISDYRIEFDGVQVPYKHVKGGEVKNIPLPSNLTMMEEDEKGEVKHTKISINWLVSQAQFKQGEEKKVKISYTSQYQMSTGGWSDDSDFDAETFRYLLSTGATWKGPIKKGIITISAISIDPDSFIIKPAGKFDRKENTFTWKFENLKPTSPDDIIIDFNNQTSIKMNYSARNEEFGQSYYVMQESQDRYYYAFHSYAITASSTLNPSDRYSAENIKSYKKDTAWCEGKTTDGIGESLLLTLNEPAEVTQIGVIPGYMKTRETYFNNNRIAQITAIINDTYKVSTSFQDEYTSYYPIYPKAYQYIDLSGYKGTVKTIKLIIEKVYPGAKYHDTCISKVVLQKQFKTKPPVHGAR